VALAAATIGAIDARATMIVLPADHVIAPTSEFERMLQRGVELAADDRTLVTFGVPPTGPATGYGYLECGAPFDDREPQALRALRFREKPDAATARQFVAAGNFLWNSGIFVWTVPGIRAAMLAADPALAAAEAGMLAARQQGRPAAVARAFRQAPKTSIDFAVMERAPSVVVVRATVNWDDVGSFTALPSVAPTDALGNTALLAAGATQIVCQSQQNIVYAEGRRTVALFGVRDLVVVAVDDAVLVCPREQAQDLKTLIARVRAEGREDLL
jgi:mannose-1-phosphate guanylyltransferase